MAVRRCKRKNRHSCCVEKLRRVRFLRRQVPPWQLQPCFVFDFDVAFEFVVASFSWASLMLLLTLGALLPSHFPACGCRCYNLLVAFRRCVSRIRRWQASSLINGGMVQGSARQVLNLKTRVRFPVPLPNSLFLISSASHAEMITRV